MGINEGSPQMNSDGKKNEEAAANGRKMLWSVGRGQVDLYEPLEQRGKHAPQFLGTARDNASP